MRRVPLLLVLLSCFALADDKALKDAELALARGDHEKATSILSQELRTAKEGKDYLLYLMGVAQLAAGKPDDALASFDRLLADHKDSAWRTKATFRRADALAAKGNYEAAMRVYEDQVGAVRAEDRRLALAMVYVSAAREFLTPKKEGQTPEYQKALDLLLKAQEIGALGKEKDRVAYEVPFCQHKLGQHQAAVDGFEKLITDAPKGECADDALFHRGLSLHALGRFLEAREAWARVVAEFAASDWAADALMETGRSHAGGANTEDLVRAVAAYRRVVKDYPKDDRAPQALGAIAGTYLGIAGMTKEAYAAVEELITAYPKSASAAEALNAKANDLLGERKYDEAIAEWNRFIELFPQSPLFRPVTQQIIDARHAKAYEAYLDKRWEAARKLFDEFLAAYPLDPRAPQANYLYGEMAHEEKKHDDAIAAWKRVVEKYPGTDEAFHAQLQIAETLANDQGKFEEALKEYAKVTGGQWAGVAQQRIQQIEGKTLALVTEKAIPTGSKATVKLKTRNVEKAKFRIYRVDLKDYFLKTVRGAGWDALDIALIAPDKEWDHAVEGYAKHKEFAIDVELPFNEAGAYIVTATEETLEAKTLVLVSDLGVVLKATQRGARVFIQDLKNNMMTEVDGLTIGSDGRLMPDPAKFPDDRTTQRLSAFIESMGQFVAIETDLSGFPKAEKPHARGFALVDRSTYQPGERVQLWVALRDVKDDALGVPEPGKKAVIEVFLADGRSYWKQEVAAGAFGTYGGSFALDPATPAGWMSVQVKWKEQVLANTGFQVGEFPAEAWTAEFTGAPKEVKAGERVKVTLTLRDAEGRAAAGRKVTYHINRVDMNRTAVTDEMGQITVEVDTERYYWQDFVFIEAYVAGAPRAFTKLVKVIDPGYRVEFKDVRPAYVSEEKVSIRVRTWGYDEKARSAKLAWRAFRAADSGEKEVGRGDVETSKEDGEALVDFEAKEGGAYRLEVEGRDSQDVPIVVSARFAVSDGKGKDETKLHAWAEKTEVKAGEDLALTLHWRGEKATALISVEGIEVVKRAFMDIKQGSHKLSIDLDGRYLPIFRVVVTVQSENKTHQDVVGFTMKRELSVTASVENAEVKPGESVKVTVTVKDEGKPVDANVLVVAYDEELEPVFGALGQPLDATFFPRDANTYVATISSVPFTYDGGGTQRDVQMMQVIAQLEAMERLQNAPVMLQQPRVQFDDHLTLTEYGSFVGQAEGEYGGRFGGKRNLVARGGGAREGRPAETFPAFTPAPVFWKSDVATGKDGEATITLAAPTRLARLKLLAIAFARDASTGRGSASLRVTQPIHVTLDSPRLLREGDKGTARVVLRGEGDGGHDVDLRFTVHQGGKDSTYVEKMSFGGTVERTFDVPATSPGPGWVQITVNQQSVRKPLTIEAWGTPRALTQSGAAEGRTALTVEVPATKDAIAPAIEVLVDRGEVELLRFLDEADLADDGVAAEALRLAARMDAKGLMTHPKNATKHGWAVDTEIKDLSRRLMLLQNPDGGWPWQRTRQSAELSVQTMANQPAGQSRRQMEQQNDQEYVRARHLPSDPFVTALAFHVLTRVEKAGDKDLAPVLDGAQEWLLRTFRDTEENDLKALCLAALSLRTDSQIFAYANRLYRGKETLGPRALVLTAIAFQQIGKTAEAKEMLALFAAKGVVKDGFAYWEMPADELGGLQSTVELTALGVEAMALLTPDDARIAQGWTWLLAQRAGHGWRTATETLLCADVATILASQRADFAAPETVTVIVNGKAIATVGAADSVAWGRVRVPAALLKEGANEVVLEPKGGGRLHYAARLTYATPGYTGVDSETLEKTRHFPPMRDDGEGLSIGYSVVRGTFKPLENPLETIAAQEPFTVTLQVEVKDRTQRYLVIEDPIPAGCSVVDGSVAGEYASYSVERGRVVFHLQHEGDHGVYDLSYRLYPQHVGAYRMPPTAIGSPAAAEPSWIGVHEKPFTVLAAGANFRETYVRTPDELYQLGKRLHGRKENEKALGPLEELLSKWKLAENVYTDVSRMLVAIYLEKKDSANVVRFFEVLKEKDPAAVVPFDDIVKIGGAYRDMNEWERAMQVFRGTLDSYFLQEANVSGSLEAVGKARSSVEFMKKLALSFPDTEETRKTIYYLGGDLFRRAKGMTEGPKPTDPEKFSRSELLAESIAMLRGSLRENPTAKNIDEVVFTLGNAYLEQEAYETAEAWSRLSYERYKDSRFHSSFEYMVAYALFALKKYEQALAMCDTIIAASNPGPSAYAPQARHMMGQIFHAMGNVEKALASYREVKAEFADAARAIDYLEKQALALPEVTTVALKDKHEVELESRGVGEVTMKAYKVDLMMLYLKQRSLNDVTRVNLAGVKPVWEKSVKLENGSHFKKVLTKIGIDVKGPGAFLVIARSGDISASGMLISSDVTLDVQVDPNMGLVRTNVIGRTDGRFVENAKVSGIGSRDAGFSQSRTDLRGVAELEGLRGFPTVIVEKDGHYGFYRGGTDLAMAEAAARQEAYQTQTKQQMGKNKALEVLEKNLKGLNDEQNFRWIENSNRAQKGCEIERTK